MTSLGIYATEGARIFLSSLKHRLAPKSYSGNANEICKAIVRDCWNGKYFQTSTGNFAQFWTRDFGFCSSSLLTLGYQEKVHQTLKYALHIFKAHGKITTTITPSGKPYDFPRSAVDSLPWLIHSIKLSKFPYYDFKPLLDQHIANFCHKVVDSKGLVNKDTPFSSMKDFAVRSSSCYDNCMLAMMAQDLKDMKLENPLARFDYIYLIMRNFWNGKFFYDDLKHEEYIAGDANLFPFLLGICRDDAKLRVVLFNIREAGLDDPFPLKYTTSRANVKFISQEIFLEDYESNTLWMHMGPLFVKVVERIDPDLALGYTLKYAELIEKNKNFIEVFFPDETPYKTGFYAADRGMLWAANYLTLKGA